MVARLQAGEARLRGGQVVAGVAAELQELGRHPGADDVRTEVVRSGVAAPVAVEAGEGIEAARFELLAEDVLGHTPI